MGDINPAGIYAQLFNKVGELKASVQCPEGKMASVRYVVAGQTYKFKLDQKKKAVIIDYPAKQLKLTLFGAPTHRAAVTRVPSNSEELKEALKKGAFNAKLLVRAVDKNGNGIHEHANSDFGDFTLFKGFLIVAQGFLQNPPPAQCARKKKKSV